MATQTIENTDTGTNNDKGDDKLFSEVIPAEFRDKPYLKDLASMKQGPEAYVELFKKFDGAQALIGKKTGAPAADAPPEEWDKFHQGFRPEKAEDYVVQGKEGAKVDEDFVGILRNAFHAAGMTKRQAEQFQGPLMKFFAERETAALAATKESDAKFDTLVKATFGAENEKILARAKAIIKDHTPENLQDHVGKLSNEGMTILAGVVESIRKKYISEDHIDNKDDLAGGGSDTDLRAEGKRLMASKEYTNEFHPDHEKVKAQVADVYTRIGKLADAAENKK